MSRMEEVAAELNAAIAVVSSGTATSKELDDAAHQIPLILERMREVREQSFEEVLKLARGPIPPSRP